jgi:uncharacterized protein (UPF0335 family)
MDQVITIGETKVSRRCWARDPELYAMVERCRRLAREKAELQNQVDRLEADLEHHRRDEQAERYDEEADLAFRIAAMANDVTDRIGRTTDGSAK